MTGIIAHTDKPGAAAAVGELVRELEKRSVPFLPDRGAALLAGRPEGLGEAELAQQCSLLVVLGGDGTILRAVQEIPGKLPTIFGINIGTLGFLTCAGAGEIARAAESIASGDFKLSPRTLMKASLHRPGRPAETLDALNDVVVGRGGHSQLVRVRVSIGGTPFTEYNADGLVVATPTGSTAYSLSAGGPILLPDCGCFVVTPICPHVLTNRSVVTADTSIVEISPAKPDRPVSITADARPWGQLAAGETLVLEKSLRTLPLAMLPERPFAEVLRQKLKWSGSNI